MEISLLFLPQVLYNKAYAELQLGRRQQCDELLENGRETASGVSESRHRIITSAIESLKVNVYCTTHVTYIWKKKGCLLSWVYCRTFDNGLNLSIRTHF